MKKSFFVVVVVALFIMSNSNVWAGTKSCPQCWAELKAKGIKSVKVTPIATRDIVKVHMGSIKQALERAGINEPVSIFLSIGDKNLGYLGSFAPSVRDDGEHGDGTANRPIFKSMPTARNLKVNHEIFSVKQREPQAGSGTVNRTSKLIRPSRPSNPETLIRPSRPSNPETMIRPSRPSHPGAMARPSRPSRPSGPVREIRPQTSQQLQGLLTFKNSKGQTMVYLPVEIVGMQNR